MKSATYKIDSIKIKGIRSMLKEIDLILQQDYIRILIIVAVVSYYYKTPFA